MVRRQGDSHPRRLAAVQRPARVVEGESMMLRRQRRRERQELWCHDCENYVQFDIDVSLDGNHVLECPRCGHEHCRVVRNGKITDIRWDSRNGQTYAVSVATVTVSSSS